MLQNLKQDLKNLADPEKAKICARFFKTAKGQYGEGDIFLGITVPQQRIIAKKYYKDLNLNDLQKLLDSKIHEERLVALLMLVLKFDNCHSERSDSEMKNLKLEKRDSSMPLNDFRKKIVNFYLKNTKKINNWDLVDSSADKILGEFLLNKSEKEKQIIYKLAVSENLWERRIAMITTFQFIKNKQFDDALKVAEILLKDKHDLIHKAVGWMLREIGKKDLQTEIDFLDKHCKIMPRTTLRYAIEKFEEKKRKFYLSK